MKMNDRNKFSGTDGKTQFFNGTEWKDISEYQKGDKVLQYNEDGTATLVEPLDFFKFPSNEHIFFEVCGNPSFCHSKNQTMIIRANTRGDIRKVSLSDIIFKDCGGFIDCCKYDGGVTLSRKELREEIRKVEDGVEEKYPKEFKNLSMRSKEDFLDILFPEMFKNLSTKSDEDLIDTLLQAEPEDTDPKICATYTGKDPETVYNIASMSGFSCVEDHGLDILRDVFGRWVFTEGYEVADQCEVKEGYNFVVPSHMLVLRRYSNIYVVGDGVPFEDKDVYTF